jgi:hypothetical protein
MTIYDLQDDLLERERMKKLDSDICCDIDLVVTQLETRVEARISNAILDVLDEGNEIDFAFYHPFEPVADQARIMFRDRVIEKLRGGN